MAKFYSKPFFMGQIENYSNLPDNVKKEIDSWPYHCIQEVGTANCTLSSYNMGISVRQGIEFFEWLIGMEQKLAPPLTMIQPTHKITNKEPSNGR